MHEVSKNTDRPQAQNVAICLSTWREAKGQKKLMQSPALYRAARIESGAIDDDKRTVSFSFSSRTPVKRRIGDKAFREVLSHDIGAIDDGRLTKGVVPLLWNHNWDNQIGRIVTYGVQNGRGVATAVLSPNQNGDEALRDIKAGIKTAISVGYIPRAMRCLRKRGEPKVELDDEKLRSPGRDDDPDEIDDPDDLFDDTDSDEGDDDDDDSDLFEVSRWEPIEVSLVSVPADPSVGVGRGIDQTLYEVRMLGEPDEVVPELKVNLERENLMPENTATPPVAAPPVVEIKNEEMSRIRETEMVRIREIQAFGSKFNAAPEAEEYIRNGKPVADFTSFILREKVPVNAPVTTVAEPSLGFGARDRSRYSIVRAIQKKIRAQNGEGKFDGFESEVSQEIARIHGQSPQGFFMPDWALTRDLTVSPPATGGVTVQTTVEPSLIPLLRNRTAVLQAGARYMSGLQGNLSMPRQNAPSTITWNTEIAAVTESDLKMEAITLSPNRVGGWCNYSKQLLAQSSLDIDNVVRDDMVQVIQIAIDSVALNGTGTNQPTGILNTPANPSTLPYNYSQAAPSVIFGPSGYPTWAQVIAMESHVESGNLVLDDSACYITTPAVKGTWKSLAKNDPRNTAGPYFPVFFWEPDNTVNGYRAIPTNQVQGDKVVFGKWNELMIGQWAGLDIVVDIYTLATQAEIRVITNMFVDVKYRYASAFCYSTNSGITGMSVQSADEMAPSDYPDHGKAHQHGKKTP